MFEGIGSGTPVVVAEVSANHGGKEKHMYSLLRAIAGTGAKVVKFQHYTPDTLTVRSSRPEFTVKGGTSWDGQTLYDLYAEAMTPWEWTRDMVALCRDLGMEWFSTPFDHSAVDYLEEFEPVAYKIASFELVDLPLIRYVASRRRPVVISTGMATEDEIDRAVDAAWESGASQVILLRCNSSYPADPTEMDLAAIPFMAERWKTPIGLSDHTLSSTSSVVAVALGAVMIEKHVTLNRSNGGPDSAFSLEPTELKSLINDVEEAARAIGTVRFGPTESEHSSLVFRRSLRFVTPLLTGDEITPGSVRSMRPAGGLEPDQLTNVIGRRVNCSVEVGEPVTWKVVD